jgi:hypothetical protein
VGEGLSAPVTILWLGNLHFAPCLDPARFRLIRLDLRETGPGYWERFLDLAGGVPDLAVLADSSLPPMLLDAHRVPVPTVFYSVDSHIHGWHPVYARAFDLVVHAQKNARQEFLEAGCDERRLIWLPLFSRPGDAPGQAEKSLDVVFVGTVDAQTTPGRARLLAELAGLVPELTVTAGDYREIYPKAKVVLNVAERGDLNFRVFEALACGACLVTPDGVSGQDELFAPGEDFFVYDQNDVPGLASLLGRLLADPAARDKAAARGLASVRGVHDAPARARSFADFLGGFDLPALAARRLTHAEVIFDAALRLLYLHSAEAYEQSLYRQVYLDAAKQ